MSQFFFNFKEKYFIEKLLIILIPFLFIFSRFFLEISLIYITFSSLIKIYKKKEFNYLNNNFFKFFILFYMIILFCYLVRNENFFDESIFFYLRYGLYVISIFYFLSKITNLDQLFFLSVKISILMLFFDTTFQYLNGQNLLGYTPPQPNRMASFFDDEAIMGSFIIHFYPFIILQEIEKKRYFQIILFTVLSFYLILLSGERSSLGLFIIFIIILLIAFNHLFNLKKIILIFFVFLSSIISVFFFSSEFKQRYFDQTLFEMKNFTDGINKEFETMDLRDKVLFKNFYIFSGYHNNLFLTSIEFFKSNKITGVGPRGFKNLCKKLIKNDKKGNIFIDQSKFDLNKHSCNNHPHNYYLQILAEMGLIGILFLISFYIFLIYKYLNSLFLRNDKNRNDYFLIIYSIYLLNLWPITTTGDFFNNWLSIIIYLPFAFYLFKKKNINNIY
jgi:O-antigen ligase